MEHEQEQKRAIVISYRELYKLGMPNDEIHGILVVGHDKWAAIGATVDLYMDPNENTAYLVVRGVSEAIIALVHEMTDQMIDISYTD